jgi:hypothetical protein
MCQRAPTRLAAASSTTSMTREHQRHILAIESIWLVVPFALGAADTQDDPLLVSFPLRAGLLLLTGWATVFSTAMSLPEEGPRQQRSHVAALLLSADRTCARLLFVALLYVHTTGQASQPCLLGGAVPAAVTALFYLAARFAENKVAGTWVHLLFRYTGWLWLTWAITRARGARWTLLMSLLYFGHILFTLHRMSHAARFRSPTFRAAHAWVGGSAEVCALCACTVAVSLTWVSVV